MGVLTLKDYCEDLTGAFELAQYSTGGELFKVKCNEAQSNNVGSQCVEDLYLQIILMISFILDIANSFLIITT